ncbi:MAG TPA: hypothetical protein PJ982_08050, partial [Lacipirellulaceae bacterium]|nr:hypothetical protein [Lacipirellulaceae bacterium]
GREELVEARAALPDGDHWTLWTLAGGPASGEAGGDEPLLPYPPGHEVLAVRRASRGARQAELSLAMAPIEELLALWQNAGWTIREAPPGDSPDASVPQTWLAVRGSRAVSVGLMTVADEQFLLTVAADSASPGTASGE